jgi:hypothetical protein
MGSKRNDEDPHGGCGPTPKLRLAGQIDGVVDGRPVSLVAERQDLVLTVVRWRTLLTIRRSSRFLIRPVSEFLAQADLRLFVRIKWLGQVEVNPNPSLFVRLLLPLH